MSTTSTLALFGRLILSLAVVIGLMWFAARVVRKRGIGGPNRKPGVHIDVIARKTLGRNSSIAVVRAADRGMIVGVTDNHITKLADADLDAIEIAIAESQWTAPAHGQPGPNPSWKAMLDQLRDRTVRR